MNWINEYQMTRGIRLPEYELFPFPSPSHSLSWKISVDYADKKDMPQILTVFCKYP